jgi:hypothetical protein
MAVVVAGVRYVLSLHGQFLKNKSFIFVRHGFCLPCNRRLLEEEGKTYNDMICG